MRLPVAILVSIFFLLNISSTLRAQTIFEAARTGNLARVKELTEKDKNSVNKKENRGRTPLFYAIIGKSQPVIQYLIDNGADVNLMLRHNGSLLDLALQTDQKQIADLLVSKGVKTTPVTFSAKQLSSSITQFSFTSGMMNNILISEGKDGLLIFDTGYSKVSVEELRKYLSGNYKSNVTYIFNSHTHGDHIAGNKSFGLDKNRIICSSFLQNNYESIGAAKVVTPITGRTGKSFKSYYTITLNGEEIRMIPYPGIHSDEDLLYYFTKSKVAFLGDLLLSQCFPAVSSPASYSRFLDEIIDIFPEDITFVSGHGKEITFKELKDYHTLLKGTASLVKKEMDKDKSLETIEKENILKKYRKDYSFLDFLGPETWIRVVFNELK